MILDMHVHSTFSFDGEDEAERMIEAAMETGLNAMALTDHLDVNAYYDDELKQSVLIPQAKAKLPEIKAKYEGRFEFCIGLELAQATHDIAKTEELLGDFKYDIILGSVHAIRNEKDFYWIDYKNADCRKLLNGYFEEILETVEWGGIDVIAHLTYPLRYIIGRCGINYPIEKHDDIIEEILRQAAKKDKGLEINTGGFRTENYHSFDPPLRYVRRFRELGGEIVTIGSDAHRAGDIAKNFDEARLLVKTAGFEQISYFKDRKAIQERI